MMKVWNTNKARALGMSWLAAALSLSLAAGCLEEQGPSAEESSETAVETVTVPASAQTSASLGIAAWRYQPAKDGVLVTGAAADAPGAPLARFLVGQGATAGEMTARDLDGKDAVTIVLAGGIRGGGEALRADVAAFRADVEAHQKLTMKRDRNIGENVYLCPGQQGTFTTWFFGNTSIGITTYATSARFSFQAAAGAPEYNTVPAYSTYVYPRIFGGFNVNVKNVSTSGSCARIQVW